MTRRLRRTLTVLPLAALALTAPLVRGASAQGGSPYDRAALVVLVPRVSFEQLLSIPEVRALARAGGAGLLANAEELRISPPAIAGGLAPREEFLTLDPERLGGLAAVGIAIRSAVKSSTEEELLVLVVSRDQSQAMIAAKDELEPVVMAIGSPRLLLPDSGRPATLRSDSTRRVGVVDGDDVWATLFDFLGAPAPDGGSIIRVVGAPAPFELHERYLAMRRMSVPVPTAAGIYVTVAGLFAVAMIALRRRASRRLVRLAGWLALTVPVLAVGLLAAGHLPTLSYATVVPFVIAVTLAGTLVIVPLQRFGALTPPAAIGAGVLAFFAIEAAFGWMAALTPFLGGSELDGGRFYGLPNEFIGLLIGACLYLVARWKPWSGFVVIVAVAMFAGLPGIGANLGGAVSLFAAGGLWLALRSRGRLGWRELALACAVVVVGTGAVLLANRFLASTPTHITRFEEAGGGLGHVLRTIGDRLLVGWRLIVRNPFALVPVLGVPASLLAVLRPAPPVREALAHHPEWRDAILVLLLASVVAYVANDSGAAACGLGFGLGLGGLLYVSCAEQTWKIDAA